MGRFNDWKIQNHVKHVYEALLKRIAKAESNGQIKMLARGEGSLLLGDLLASFRSACLGEFAHPFGATVEVSAGTGGHWPS